MSQTLGKPLADQAAASVPPRAFWAVVVVDPDSKEEPYLSTPFANVHDAIAVLETLLQRLKETYGD